MSGRPFTTGRGLAMTHSTSHAQPEALHSVIEELVTREGTDYGEHDIPSPPKSCRSANSSTRGMQSSSTTRKPKVVRCNQATGAQSTSSEHTASARRRPPREGHDTRSGWRGAGVSLQDVLPLGVATSRGKATPRRVTAGVRPAQSPCGGSPVRARRQSPPPGARPPGASRPPRRSCAASQSHWAAPGTGTASETPRAVPARPTRHRDTR